LRVPPKALGLAVAVPGYGESWNPDGSVEERIQSLRDQVVNLRNQIATAEQAVRKEISRRGDELAARIDALRTDLMDLRSTFRASEEQSSDLDARGLLPIGFGILLSGAPDELAQAPRWLGGPWLGVVLVIGGVVASVACLAVLWKHYAASWRQRSAAAAGGTN